MRISPQRLCGSAIYGVESDFDPLCHVQYQPDPIDAFAKSAVLERFPDARRGFQESTGLIAGSAPRPEPCATLGASVVLLNLFLDAFAQKSVGIVSPVFVPVFSTFGQNFPAINSSQDLSTLFTSGLRDAAISAVGLTVTPAGFDSANAAMSLAECGNNTYCNTYKPPASTYTACSSRLCLQQPYATLSLCSACKEITDKLNRRCGPNQVHCESTLHNGVLLEEGRQTAVFSSSFIDDDEHFAESVLLVISALLRR